MWGHIDPNNVFLWGLRGQLGYGQHAMQLGHTFTEKKKVRESKSQLWGHIDPNNVFLWGLRGQLGYGQHAMQLGHTFTEKKK
ncbi:Uncharacterized protein OBRU01_04831, partial [Operophtera brumata]